MTQYFVLLTALVFTTAAHAEMLNVRSAPFSAVGDGTTDDRSAFARAFAAAQAGDTVMVPPGDYRIVLTGGALAIPEGVMLWGQAGKSRLLLTTNGKDSDYREFLRPKSDVTVEGISIVRDADFPAVLLPISGDASNITFRHCEIQGGRDRLAKNYCHAFRVGSGVVKGLVLDGITVESCSYGLFQPNQATGTLEGVVVRHCRFEQNTSSDLEFNSPNGVMRDIVVQECFFRDNLCKTPSGGFAVGFANVADGRVERCMIRNYGSEALHVEDRSTDIELTGNTIVGGSTRQSNGVILIVNNSRRINIRENHIDARPNENAPHLILVTAGGKNFANPGEVSVSDNVLVNGSATRTWYLQKGCGPEPTGNVVIPHPEPSKP